MSLLLLLLLTTTMMMMTLDAGQRCSRELVCYFSDFTVYWSARQTNQNVVYGPEWTAIHFLRILYWRASSTSLPSISCSLLADACIRFPVIRLALSRKYTWRAVTLNMQLKYFNFNKCLWSKNKTQVFCDIECGRQEISLLKVAPYPVLNSYFSSRGFEAVCCYDT